MNFRFIRFINLIRFLVNNAMVNMRSLCVNKCYCHAREEVHHLSMSLGIGSTVDRQRKQGKLD